MLADVVAALRCPICAEPLVATDDLAVLRCGRSHSFDVARQGYVSLLDGRSSSLHADTAAMVASRERVHAAGVLDPVVDQLATSVAELDPAMIIDLGGGPGHYLRACMTRVPAARGLGLDLSKYCARAVVGGTPVAAAVVADVWRGLPLAADVADVALSVFAPRNPAETARVLRRGGYLLIVAPEPDHLAELIAPMGMLSVSADKADQVSAAISPDFDVVDRISLHYQRELSAPTIADLVAMGPSAFHRDEAAVRSAADALATDHNARVQVTCAVTLTVCRVRDRSAQRPAAS